MPFEPWPFGARLEQYRQQAEELFAGYQSGDPAAIRFLKEQHPLFRDGKIRWLPRNVPDSEVRDAGLDFTDAQLAVARGYDFLDWPALKQWVEAVGQQDSPVCRFESAVEAVINGDLAALEILLRADPGLVRARSTRVTPFDPPVHRATLLHYLGANGVEGYRQKSPPNAVAIAEALLKAGAEVDALADMYGAGCTTMTMLVSSSPPAKAGVQAALVDTLLDFGAAIEGAGTRKWGSLVVTALAFGCPDAARALVRRGARIDLAAAAGLGRLDDARRLLPAADAASRHRALALGSQYGHAGVVRLLLEAGEDPDRYNPEGTHAHSTPLHQAALAGHAGVVRLLVERGARLDIKDTVYQSTPLGWAMYGGQGEIESYLRAHGAKTGAEVGQ